MFSNPTTPRSTQDEGVVMQVDVNRSLCKVRTQTGKMLPQVMWMSQYGGSARGGDRFTPNVGDRVVLNYGLGYPVIEGCLPRIQTDAGATPLTIHDGTSGIETGSYGVSNIAIGDINKPQDFISGDRILSTPGGAMLGLLRGGSIFIRASRAAEIALNKVLGAVRIFSRNFEHFSDVSSDVIKNFQGRVYRYVGYAQDYGKAKIEDYRYNLYYGDVAAAKAVKTNYATYSGTPDSNTLLFEEQVLGDTANELMHRTIAINGNEEVYITDGTNFTRVTTQAGELILSYNDANTVTISPTSIVSTIGGISTVSITGSQVVVDSPLLKATQNLTVGNGASGTFTTASGDTVIVQDGIITNIY